MARISFPIAVQLRLGRLWLALCCGLAIVDAHGGKPSSRVDPNYLIDTWETEDGLPENSATAMAQTPDGYLWFGTFKGLVRFDGVKFTVFDSLNTPQLPSSGIVNLHADRRGQLWVSTQEGLVVMGSGERQEAGSKWRSFGTNEGWAGDYVRTFAERTNGDLLMTTFDGSVLEFAKGRLAALPTPPGTAGKGYLGQADERGEWWVAQEGFVGMWDGWRWTRLAGFTNLPAVNLGAGAARDGGLWLLANRELRKYRGGVEVSRLRLPGEPGGFWSLLEDSQTNVWIATYNAGVWRVAPDGAMLRWKLSDGLAANAARFVFEDAEHNTWVGTSGGGLSRFKPRRALSFGTESGLDEPAVNSICPGPEGGVLVATYGMGVFQSKEALGILNRPAHSVSNSPAPLAEREFSLFSSSGPKSPISYALAILTDHLRRVWVGTDKAGLWLIEGQSTRMVPRQEVGGENVISIFEDSRGRIWLGDGQGVTICESNQFRIYQAAQGLPKGAVCGFGEDTSGAIWASNLRGVFRFGEGRFTQVTDETNQPIRDVSCFKADGAGTMWMGSLREGLLRWRQGRLTRLDARTGLASIPVHGLIEDDRGFVWLASNHSIVRVSWAELRRAGNGAISPVVCQELDVTDGLASADCARGHQPVCARDDRGRLWFATVKGAVMIDPARFHVNTRPPSVQIERLALGTPARGAPARATKFTGPHWEAPFAEPVRLPPGVREIEISYTALSFAAPEDVRFEVKLEGGETEWRAVGDRREAYYVDLPPREYVFWVRAANNDGVWNEAGTSLAFTLEPFFWQTGWFRLVIAMALIGSGGGAVAAWAFSKRRKDLAELEHTRQQRAELAHLSRVTMLGELSGSLAHELNQPLGAILRNAEAAELFLQEPAPDLVELRAILVDIRKDDQRAGAVIDRMRALLKRREPQYSLLDLNELTGEVISLVRPDADARKVRLALEPVSSLPPVRGDHVQLQQVLLNLLLNAMDAMNGSASVERRVTVRVQAAGPQVEVVVTDTGHGIPADKLARIFEPFFTTKTQGLGMGLAISQTIITAHGGRITAENNENGGATFRFTVPAATPLGGKS